MADFSPASIKLENRSCTITVGTVQIKDIGLTIGLDVWFSIRRSLKPKEPNTADLRLYGLSTDSRAAMAASTVGTVQAIFSKGGAPKGGKDTIVPVQIEAGYVGGTSILFTGEMRSAQTTTDGPDTVTELTTGDGDAASIVARSTASFGVGSTAYTVAQQLLSDMGIGVGNLSSVASVLMASKMFTSGVVLKGSSLEHMVDLAAGSGLEFSIQHGVAQFVKLGQPLGAQAYELNSNTGLIGSPSIDTKGILTLQTLMIPGIAPGLPIVVSAKYISGTYRIVSIETTGNTGGDEWTHQIQCRPFGTGI